MQAKLLRTKAGNGYKIVVNGVWYYTSATEFARYIAGKTASVNFRDRSEIAPVSAEGAANAAPALDMDALNADSARRNARDYTIGYKHTKVEEHED